MNICSSGNKVTFDKVDAEAGDGKIVASIIDVVMDRKFIEQSRYDWCWLSSKDVPAETGWYRIDRSRGEMAKITNEQATGLEWHERLYVYGSGHAAVREDLPLALYIGDEYTDSRLSGLYLCGPDVLTWVALKEKN